ncbi:hypothetical protein [Hymenobacter sp. CRA2]|uniref:hypothetical protein n=1 Tax=Hymenobacter sp. CRA2 TaxID=1955620 RepID=UPI00098F7847|nr:hypothetical protein [Hymenobacter sp. CRA2]OON69381.1 hypothetical protein B0919_08860 [Hymenobacter sp. CRA2]
MNKLVLLFATVATLVATQVEARPRPRYVRDKMNGRSHTHRPNYSRYHGAGSPFRGILAVLR